MTVTHSRGLTLYGDLRITPKLAVATTPFIKGREKVGKKGEVSLLLIILTPPSRWSRDGD